MRPLFVVGVLVALGVLAAVLARLGGALAQLRTLDVQATPVAAALPEDAADASVLGEAPAPLVASEARADFGDEERPARVASGDAHIMRALAADPEFQRAAADLLHDPDPAAQAEARQLLRELGVDQSE